MAQNWHREGEKRTCPYCGQAATFSHRTRVPGTGDQQGPAPRGEDPGAEFKPGWTCENKHCSRRVDFNK